MKCLDDEKTFRGRSHILIEWNFKDSARSLPFSPSYTYDVCDCTMVDMVKRAFGDFYIYLGRLGISSDDVLLRVVSIVNLGKQIF